MPHFDPSTESHKGLNHDALSHKDWQDEFAQGLESRLQVPPNSMFDGEPRARQAGWQVYLNNVTHSLTSALGDTFPVCKELVGEEFFAFAAHTFLLEGLPTSPALLGFGGAFPDFLERFEPTGSLPWLSDVARLEFCWLKSYHAEDKVGLSAKTLAETPPDIISNSHLTLDPSVHFLHSHYPVCEIWHAHQTPGADLARIDLTKPECALILRHQGVINIMSISPAMTTFLEALSDNVPLIQADTLAHKAGKNFDLQNALNLLLMYDLIIAIKPPEEASQ